MGILVEAHCRCGYHRADIRVGGGMHTFASECDFPVFCKTCNDLTQANLLAAPPRCLECAGTSITPYDDLSLPCDQAGQPVATWDVTPEIGRELVLHDGNYICPACKELTLTFSLSGMWD
jgi:hypothetical protein